MKISYPMLKQLTITTFAILALSSVNAQQADQRIVDFYGEKAVAKLEQNNPDSVAFLNYFVQEGFTIQHEVPENKLQGLKLLSEMELSDKKKKFKTVEDLSEFNRLEVMDANPDPVAATLYRVDGTNKVLILPAYNELRAIFDSSH